MKLSHVSGRRSRRVATPSVPSGGVTMRYRLTPINTRPWLLNGLSLRLIESHYENHYGGALRRLNAITAQLESLARNKITSAISRG